MHWLNILSLGWVRLGGPFPLYLSNKEETPLSLRAVVGGGRGLLALWDLVEGCEVWREGAAHEGRVTALAVGDQGRLVISGGEDRRVIIWRPD